MCMTSVTARACQCCIKSDFECAGDFASLSFRSDVVGMCACVRVCVCVCVCCQCLLCHSMVDFLRQPGSARDGSGFHSIWEHLPTQANLFLIYLIFIRLLADCMGRPPLTDRTCFPAQSATRFPPSVLSSLRPEGGRISRGGFLCVCSACWGLGMIILSVIYHTHVA
jgi:hypothetical protein